jgi:hypothetical protein
MALVWLDKVKKAKGNFDDVQFDGDEGVKEVFESKIKKAFSLKVVKTQANINGDI